MEIEDYQQQLLSSLYEAKDLNIVKALLGKAAKVFSPSELRNHYDAVTFERLHVPREEFIRAAPMWGMLKNRPIPKISTRILSPNAVFHEAGEILKQDKCLLICLGGIEGGLYLSPARFMLELPHGKFDYLVLSPRQTANPQGLAYYTSGVPGFGESLEEISKLIEISFTPGEYRTTAVVGTSLGGFAAIDLADYMGADAGISIGGRMEFLGGVVPPEILFKTPPARLCNCRKWNPEVRLHLLFGADNRRDRSSANQLRRVNPDLTLWPIPGLDAHDPFPYLAACKRLKHFFEGLHLATACLDPEPWDFTTLMPINAPTDNAP